MLSLSIGFSASAQTCAAGGINFASQADIDNFTTNYPGCTQILGGVSIIGGDIANLNGLSVVTSIGGALNISSNPISPGGHVCRKLNRLFCISLSQIPSG